MGEQTTRERHDGTTVVERIVEAMNAHDVDAMVAMLHPDYESRQPAHPARAFVGSEQVRANWTGMFAGVPDFRADIVRSVEDGDLVWCEWAWHGTRSDRELFEVCGVTLFQIRDGRVIAGTFYVEEVEAAQVGIDEAVERMSGERPAP